MPVLSRCGVSERYPTLELDIITPQTLSAHPEIPFARILSRIPPVSSKFRTQNPRHGWKGRIRVYLIAYGTKQQSDRQTALGEGFELVKVSGSHRKFRKGPITVIVPHPKKDLPLGTARAIARLAGWI